ncbi:MAG: hypothetical protein HDQ88_10590 [Clostridia bacterium]|nr:hypothetical protein [Clostridia bacterium]
MAVKKQKDDKNPKNEQKYIHLQWVGKTPAVKASELKPGDVTVWNTGATERIINVEPSKSGKTVKATIEYTNLNGKKVRTIRKLKSDRLVGIDKTASKSLKEPKKADKSVEPKKSKSVVQKPAGKGSEPKPAEPKKAPSAKKNGADRLLKHSDKDEMSLTGEKPIILNAKNAKPKIAQKVLKRAPRTGGYTAWDEIEKKGKTFATPQEAQDYAQEVTRKTGKVVPVTFTNRQVTHTFRPEEEKKKK